MTVQVHLAFQDGFADDDVVVRVDGREVARESGLKGVDPMVPLAAQRDVQVNERASQLQVEVPTRGLSRAFDLDFAESPYVGIAIVGGEIAVRQSSRPFDYF
jgi:hypothetical protein